MSDDEARLLAAVQADPDDDDARLVYADWLEERTDPRGEYLRLEVQAYRLPARLAELQRRLPPDWLAAVGRRYSVVLCGSSNNKIGAIKRVREVTGLGLKDAKDLVDAACSGVRKQIAADLDFTAARQLVASFEPSLARLEPGPFHEEAAPVPHVPRTTHPRYRCVLVSVNPERKLDAIRRVREVTARGLLDARNLVDSVNPNTPAILDAGSAAARAADIAAAFTGLGEVRLELVETE